MPEHDLEKLLGGFATDTLTAEERDVLFRTALQDQQLFNALADEQALKELLADPAVRRRLLRSLNQGVGRSPSWLDRFTSPSGLAWAGGVAVGVFAVVLGLRVYEDSLRQASQTTALEEVKPSVPSTPPAQSFEKAPSKNTVLEPPKAPPPADPRRKDALSDTTQSRELDAASRRKEKAAPEVNESDQRASVQKQELKTKESQKMDAPVAAVGKSSGQSASSLEERSASPSSPAAGADSKNLATRAEKTEINPTAKALFYGASAEEPKQEREPARRPELFALQKALDKTSPSKPLALRYRFVVRGGTEGQELDLHAAADVHQTDTMLLKIESNQDAYLQIWTRAGDALPELVLPAKETGRISLKTAAGQAQAITVPPQSDRLIVRLSRVPFGPITRQEAVMAGRGSDAQVTESASGTEEQATYVANPELSAAELAIEIPIRTTAPR